jgi:hypothetical protein
VTPGTESRTRQLRLDFAGNIMYTSVV